MRVPDVVIEALMRDEGLGHYARPLYLLICAAEPKSMSELARLAGMSRNVVGKACKNLADLDWVKLIPDKRQVRPAPHIPHVVQESLVEELTVQYSMAPNKGEFLCKKRVELWIRDDTYVDNARPEFMTNPTSNEPMECDRIHPRAKLHVEFHGWQHYGPTRMFSKKESREQQARDLMKGRLCEKNGYTFVEVSPDDLKPGVLEAKLDAVRPDLRRAYIDVDGPYYQELMRLCSAYAAKAAQDRPE